MAISCWHDKKKLIKTTYLISWQREKKRQIKGEIGVYSRVQDNLYISYSWKFIPVRVQ